MADSPPDRRSSGSVQDWRNKLDELREKIKRTKQGQGTLDTQQAAVASAIHEYAVNSSKNDSPNRQEKDATRLNTSNSDTPVTKDKGSPTDPMDSIATQAPQSDDLATKNPANISPNPAIESPKSASESHNMANESPEPVSNSEIQEVNLSAAAAQRNADENESQPGADKPAAANTLLSCETPSMVSESVGDAVPPTAIADAKADTNALNMDVVVEDGWEEMPRGLEHQEPVGLAGYLGLASKDGDVEASRSEERVGKDAEAMDVSVVRKEVTEEVEKANTARAQEATNLSTTTGPLNLNMPTHPQMEMLSPKVTLSTHCLEGSEQAEVVTLLKGGVADPAMATPVPDASVATSVLHAEPGKSAKAQIPPLGASGKESRIGYREIRLNNSFRLNASVVNSSLDYFTPQKEDNKENIPPTGRPLLPNKNLDMSKIIQSPQEGKRKSSLPLAARTPRGMFTTPRAARTPRTHSQAAGTPRTRSQAPFHATPRRVGDTPQMPLTSLTPRRPWESSPRQTLRTPLKGMSPMVPRHSPNSGSMLNGSMLNNSMLNQSMANFSVLDTSVFDLAGLGVGVRSDDSVIGAGELDQHYMALYNTCLCVDKEFQDLNVEHDKLLLEHQQLEEFYNRRGALEDSMQLTLQGQEARLAIHELEIEELSQKCDKMYTTASDDLRKAQASIEHKDNAIQSAESELSLLKRENEVTSLGLANIKPEIPRLAKKMQTGTAELQETRSQIEGTKRALASAKQELEETSVALDPTIQQAIYTTAEKEQYMQRADTRYRALSAELSMLQAQMQEKDTRMATMKHEVECWDASWEASKDLLAQQLQQLLATHHQADIGNTSDIYTALSSIMTNQTKEVQELIGYVNELLQEGGGEEEDILTF